MPIFSKKQKPSPVEIKKTEVYLTYKKQARKGDASAQFQLGECYYNGLGVEKNYEKAVKWYLEAANSGNPKAQYAMGRCYEKGVGVSRNKEKAKEWYKASAEQGYYNNDENINAQAELASIYYHEKNHLDAFKWFCKAAEQSNNHALEMAGRYYLFGTGGVKKDYDKAIKCFEKMMEKKSAAANYYMGICYEYGYGVEKNPEKAYTYYHDAVQGGYCWCKDAVYRLAKCYEDGFGVQQNIERAIRLYTNDVLLMQSYSHAQYALGNIYYLGKGVEKDITKAISAFKFAATKGHVDAQYMLGYLYYSETGVQRNCAEAIEWLRLSANEGNKDAEKLLAVCEAEYKKEKPVLTYYPDTVYPNINSSSNDLSDDEAWWAMASGMMDVDSSGM